MIKNEDTGLEIICPYCSASSDSTCDHLFADVTDDRISGGFLYDEMENFQTPPHYLEDLRKFFERHISRHGVISYSLISDSDEMNQFLYNLEQCYDYYENFDDFFDYQKLTLILLEMSGLDMYDGVFDEGAPGTSSSKKLYFSQDHEKDFQNMVKNIKYLLLTGMDPLDYSNRYFVTQNKNNQKWMDSNLNVDVFRNGDPIPHAQTNKEWKKAAFSGKPAFCYYQNDPTNGDIFGKLYNWYAFYDKRGLAPKGYYIPTDDEWDVLTKSFGGRGIAGAKLKDKGTKYWDSPNTGACDEVGFKGLPGGFRSNTGKFFSKGLLGGWWSTSKFNKETDSYTTFFSLTSDYATSYLSFMHKGFGMSVRCLKQ